jgi:hypothetical protein
MVKMQYVGEGHTYVRLEKTEEKIKVSNGEIIEVLDEKMVPRFRVWGFNIVDIDVEVTDNGEDDITIETSGDNGEDDEPKKKGKK